MCCLGPCYRIYFPDINDVVSSDNLIFDERPENCCTDFDLNLSDIEGDVSEENRDIFYSDTNLQQLEPDFGSVNSSDSEQIEEIQTIGRQLQDRRFVKAPKRTTNQDYNLDDSSDEHFANIATFGEVEDISIKDALNDKNWRQAMKDEFQS